MVAPIRSAQRFDDVRKALNIPEPALHHFVETNFPLSQPIVHLRQEFSELSELEQRLEESQNHPLKLKILALCATIFVIMWIVAGVYAAKYGGAMAKGATPILLFFGASLIGAWYQKRFLGKYTPVEHLGPVVWAISGPFVPFYSLSKREERFQGLIQQKKATLTVEIEMIHSRIQRNIKQLKDEVVRYTQTLDQEIVEAGRPHSPSHSKESSLKSAKEALDSIKQAISF
jgi:hypothetical protein